MNCPNCKTHKLTSMKFERVSVDVCQNGCGGVWFDQFEFKKVDEKAEQDGDLIANLTVKVTTSTQHPPRPCPKCSGVTMMKRFESVKRQVEIDECAKCAGIWLDAGELKTIRSQFSTEAERTKAAEAFFQDVFSKDLAAYRGQSAENRQKAESYARMLRFICPSQYIPGKQQGGAF